MNQNEELMLISQSFTDLQYFEQTPQGMAIRTLVVPDPAYSYQQNEDGSDFLDEDGQLVEVPYPLELGPLETLIEFKQRLHLLEFA